MSRLEEARRQAEIRLEESRREVEARLADVKVALESEFGTVPKRGYLLLALLAGAGGFVLGMKGRRRLPAKKRPLLRG
ncbi:MAG TPA: hypothetical protein VMM92_03350 [Thermoanaerobaculia bacterium]|nr:hypothetical protein [Thermoanaerobaculia bacterium]